MPIQDANKAPLSSAFELYNQIISQAKHDIKHSLSGKVQPLHTWCASILKKLSINDTKWYKVSKMLCRGVWEILNFVCDDEAMSSV